MKKFVFALVLALLGLVVATSAQNPNSVVAKSATDTTLLEPEWPGQPYLLVDGKLVALETQKPKVSNKVKVLGFAGGSTVYSFQGTESPKVATTTPEFLVRLEINADPATLVNIDRLVVDKKAGVRKVVVVKLTGFAGSNQAQLETLELKFAKQGNSLRFTPASPLAPGEYAVSTKVSETGFLFSVK